LNAIDRAKMILNIRYYLSHGFNTKEIGQRLRISQQMVSYYRKVLRRAYEDKIHNVNESLAGLTPDSNDVWRQYT